MHKACKPSFFLLAFIFFSIESTAQTKPPVEKPIRMDSIPKQYTRVTESSNFKWLGDRYLIFPTADGLRLESSDAKKNQILSLRRKLATPTFGVCVMKSDVWMFVIDERDYIQMYSMALKQWHEPTNSPGNVRSVVSTSLAGETCRVNTVNANGRGYFRTITGVGVWSDWSTY